MPTMEQRWETILDVLQDARGICFDGCHKIYVLMDHDQVAVQRSYGYDIIGVSDYSQDDDTVTVDEAFDIIHQWYDSSCFLKFVQSIRSVPDGGNPNDGFTDLIPQAVEEDE